MTSAILQFIFFAAVIVAAGSLLSRQADAIAEATGLGRLLIGSILLAAATSLPEVSVDIASIRQGTPNLAVGDLLGSGLMNLLILAALDMTRYSPGTMLSKTAASHALNATVSVALTAIAAAALLVERRLAGGNFLGLGPGAWLILFTYAYGSRMIFINQRIAARAAAKESKDAGTASDKPSLRNAIIFFAIGAAIILLAGPRLANAANEIAGRSGLGTTFVGTTLVALSTSLPELVTCLAAVRMGAHDLAVGNIFGSNAFNMAILAGLDVVQPGSLLAVADETHAISALCIIFATVVAVAGQLYQVERKHWFERDALVVIGIVLASLGLVYMLG